MGEIGLKHREGHSLCRRGYIMIVNEASNNSEMRGNVHLSLLLLNIRRLVNMWTRKVCGSI